MKTLKTQAKKFCFGILLLFNAHCYSATVIAVTSGDWSTNENWSPIGSPGCYDTIIIPAGITIDVTTQIDLTACPATYILVLGELHFQAGFKLDLPCGSVVFMDPSTPGVLSAGGGGGNSNYIKICGTTFWNAGDGDLTGPAILCESCTLPIELLYFNATLNAEIVEIDWKTASELNNAFFTIERSNDGYVWGSMMSIPGAGNSTSAINYYAEDRDPLNGLSYYRLKQTDYDGKFTYSDPVAINKGTVFSNNKFTVFPNPVDQNYYITVFKPNSTSSSLIEIYSLDGKLVYQESKDLSGGVGIVIPIDYTFSPGVYIIKMGESFGRFVVS